MTRWRLVVKRAFSVPTFAVRAARRIPRRWILCLHDLGSGPWSYPETRFADLVARLSAAFEFVPLQGILAGGARRRSRLAFTFDDAYLSVAERALPVLGRYGIRPTVFVPTALVGDHDGVPHGDHRLYPGLPLMGWGRLRGLLDRGFVDVGSHGARHVPLTELTAEDRLSDLRRSVRDLAERLGVRAEALAYPLGAFDGPTVSSVRTAGFRLAVTSLHGGVPARPDLLRLPRVDLRAEYEVGDVLGILRGDWDLLGALRRPRGRRAP